MFVLVKYNDLYQKNLEKIKKNNFIPVVLFQLRLNNKNQIKQDLDQILQLKNSLNLKYSAIQVILEKIENSSIGTINSLKNNFDLVIGYGGLNKINRFFLESTQIDFLQDPQNSILSNKIDFIHHFNSGINHILSKFAKEKNIGFLFSLNFLQENNHQIPKEIGRINQNIRFARKYNINSYINNIIETPQDIKSIIEIENLISLFDISTQQKKESFNLLEQKIKENKEKKSFNYISKDIKITN